jgi:hypothetical protein
MPSGGRASGGAPMLVDLFYGTGIGVDAWPFPLLCGPIFGTMARYGKRQKDPRKHAKERQELAH